MCGIVGYLGNQDVLPVLLDGLERLEYRGYDSSGVAILEVDGSITLVREIGRIKNLRKVVEQLPISGTNGIGHTRWATHGSPTKENAHPHGDVNGRVYLVHNGIIENYMDLRKELEDRGCVFASETDTEVAAQLVGEGLGEGLSLEDAVRKAVEQVRGTYALAVVSTVEPDRMIATRRGSPLILGIGEDARYVASDMSAILPYTHEVIFLEDDEIAVLERTSHVLKDASGAVIEREPVTIEWDASMAEKGGFEKFMLKEIYEQPEVIEKTIQGRVLPDGKSVVFPDMEMDDDVLRKMKKLWIVSCGTAYYAGLTGKYMLEHFTNLPVENDLASEFRYRCPKMDENTVLLVVTQSGETADTIASLREAKKHGCKIISICNVLGSTIARESDGVIYTRAGPEIGVASTKAYTSQLVAFALLSIYYAQLTGQIQDEESARLLQELNGIPDKMKEVLENISALDPAVAIMKDAHNGLYLGRGFNYPTALEGALKTKEISYIHVEGFAAGEMKHGPIALIHKELPVVCVCLNDSVREKMISNMKEVEARGGRMIAVTTKGDTHLADLAETVFEIPEIIEPWSPILAVVPLQLLAYYVALANGCDIDKPRNLAKSVTVE